MGFFIYVFKNGYIDEKEEVLCKKIEEEYKKKLRWFKEDKVVCINEWIKEIIEE